MAGIRSILKGAATPWMEGDCPYSELAQNLLQFAFNLLHSSANEPNRFSTLLNLLAVRHRPANSGLFSLFPMSSNTFKAKKTLK
jgi:hypothetical protein